MRIYDKRRIHSEWRTPCPLSPLETKAHELIGHLQPGQLAAVVRLLEVMIEDENEELTDEDRSAICNSREYFRQNPEGGLSLEKIVAGCGFTMDQVHNRKAE